MRKEREERDTTTHLIKIKSLTMPVMILDLALLEKVVALLLLVRRLTKISKTLKKTMGKNPGG